MGGSVGHVGGGSGGHVGGGSGGHVGGGSGGHVGGGSGGCVRHVGEGAFGIGIQYSYICFCIYLFTHFTHHKV